MHCVFSEPYTYQWLRDTSPEFCLANSHHFNLPALWSPSPQLRETTVLRKMPPGRNLSQCHNSCFIDFCCFQFVHSMRIICLLCHMFKKQKAPSNNITNVFSFTHTLTNLRRLKMHCSLSLPSFFPDHFHFKK